MGSGLEQRRAHLHRGAPLLRGPERGLALRQLVLRAARLLGERAHLVRVRVRVGLGLELGLGSESGLGLGLGLGLRLGLGLGAHLRLGRLDRRGEALAQLLELLALLQARA